MNDSNLVIVMQSLDVVAIKINIAVQMCVCVCVCVRTRTHAYVGGGVVRELTPHLL